MLPYHTAPYAWDYVDGDKDKVLVLESNRKNSTGSGGVEDLKEVIGMYELDKLAPGTELKVVNDKFKAEVIADGRTRVIRVTDASLSKLPSVFSRDYTASLLTVGVQFEVSERSERALMKTRLRATTKLTLFSFFWLAPFPPAPLKMRLASLGAGEARLRARV